MKKATILTAIVGVFISMLTFGQEFESKIVREGDQSIELQALSLAQKNAVLGYETQNPVYLISAAQLLIDYPASEGTVQNVKESSSEKKDGKSSDDILMDAVKLLADAKIFALGNEPATAMIESLEKLAGAATTRGAIGGPYFINRTVAKYDFNIYNIEFRAGKLAEVGIVGDGDTDLDLYIFDSNDNLIESDTDYTDDCYVSWVPKWTGLFKVVVKNHGSVYNNFALFTN